MHDVMQLATTFEMGLRWDHEALAECAESALRAWLRSVLHKEALPAHLKMLTAMVWKQKVTSQKKKKRPASGARPTTQLRTERHSQSGRFLSWHAEPVMVLSSQTVQPGQSAQSHMAAHRGSQRMQALSSPRAH